MIGLLFILPHINKPHKYIPHIINYYYLCGGKNNKYGTHRRCKM